MSSKLQLDVVTTVHGGAIWRTRTKAKGRHGVNCLQVNLCDPYLSALRTRCLSSKARYRLATKLSSTRSNLLKVHKVGRVALAPYTLATKSTIKIIGNKVDRDKLSNSRCCRFCCQNRQQSWTYTATVDFVAGFGNSRLCETKSTVLNSTLSLVCIGLKTLYKSTYLYL